MFNPKFIVMDKQSENEMINQASWLVKFLSIDISIKIFGHEILAYHFPPKKSE